MPSPSLLIDSLHPGIIILALNRPDRRNALNVELMNAVCDAVTHAEADATKRVLILHGEGPVFCAGLDLIETARSLEHAEHAAHGVARLLKTVHNSRLVSIAAVHGAAMAGGAGLMTACDLAIATEDTRIGYPEVLRGLVAGAVMHFLLMQVGDRRARELLLTAEPITAARAYEIGLVNRVVPIGAQYAEALAMAKLVLRGGPQAVLRTKQLIEVLAPKQLSDSLSHSLRQHMAARASDEAKEGLAAFAEKRPPAWL